MNLTFLNTIFLAGLAAAAIPIIIHLLQRRRLKRIEFSDLRFLGPLNQQRMRSLNLRRLLLLVLRVLIVGLTALAMARPSVRGSLTNLVPTQARSSVLLLVDTSYSMRAEGERGTALDEARAAANDVLNELRQGDEVNLMTFDATAHALFKTPVRDLDAVRMRLRELEASHHATEWSSAVHAALTALDATVNPNRELYIFSDFMGGIPDSLRADLSELQRDMRVSLVPTRVEPFVNVSIEGVTVPPGAILRDDPVRVGVSVMNHATDVPAECVLRVDLDDEVKGEASLRLGRGAVQTHDFTLVATQAQEVAGTVSKRVDRLPVDDVSHFVLPVLAQLRVLHVSGISGAGGSFFVSRALEPSRGGRTPIQLQEVEGQRLASNDLEDVQVVVVSSDALLTDSQAQILSTFVREGGGLCVLSGQRDTADPMNNLLSRIGDSRLRGVVSREDGFLNMENLRPTGILAGFKEDELRTLEAVEFTRYAELVAGPSARTVVRFAGGAPALIESGHGTGKYMVFAFDAATDGSSVALSPMFLPLLHRAVVYLAGETGRQQLVYRVGERIEAQVPIGSADRRASLPSSLRGAQDDDTRLAQAGASDGGAVPPAEDTPPRAVGDERTFTVTLPSGQREAVEARYVGKMALVAFENTHLPGHYTFEGLGHRLVRAVNIDTRESDLTPMDPEQWGRDLGVDASVLHSTASIGQHIREARHGKEIYKLLAAMVLALMVVELLLSRVSAGTSSTSES